MLHRWTPADWWHVQVVGQIIQLAMWLMFILTLVQFSTSSQKNLRQSILFYFTFLILLIYIFVLDLCCRSEKSSSCWRNVGTKQGYSWTHLVIIFSINNFGSKPQILRYGNDFILPDPRGSIDTEDQFLKEYEDKIK